MSTPATVFVINPHSAAGATLRRFERLRPQLNQALGDFDVRLTERPCHATEIVRQALAAGAERIIGVGGDGTSNEIVNGFFDEEGKALGEKARLGLIVSGTGGDYRRTLGWSAEPQDAVARLARDDSRRVDVGHVTLTAQSGESISRYFLNIASFGLSGAVDAVVNRSSKRFGAKASFIAGSLRAFASFVPPRVELTCDDGPAFEKTISLVAIANGKYFGGGMMVAPDAQVDDGKFSVVRVGDAGKRFWLKNAARIYSGSHTELDEVEVGSARTLEAKPLDGAEVLIDLDGEQPGRLPAKFTILPAAISLVV